MPRRVPSPARQSTADAGLLGVSDAGTQLRYAQATTDALGRRRRALRPARRQRAGLRRRRRRPPARSEARDRLPPALTRTSGAASRHRQRGPGARRRQPPGPGPRRQARAGAQALRLHRRAVRQPPGHAGLGRRCALPRRVPDAPARVRRCRSASVAAALNRTEFGQEPHDLQRRQRQHDHGHLRAWRGRSGDGQPRRGRRLRRDWRDVRLLRVDLRARLSTTTRARSSSASCTTASVTRTRSGTASRWSTATASRSTTPPRDELTHAVTEAHGGPRVPGGSRGALNESISDQAGWDVDPGDSTMGEDLPIGAIRDRANPGAPTGSRPRPSAGLHLQRQRRRAHEQRDPKGSTPDLGGPARTQRRRAGPLSRADRLPRPHRHARRCARGRAAGGHDSGSAPRRSATPGRHRASRRPGSLPAERGSLRHAARASHRPRRRVIRGASRTDRGTRRSHNGARC